MVLQKRPVSAFNLQIAAALLPPQQTGGLFLADLTSSGTTMTLTKTKPLQSTKKYQALIPTPVARSHRMERQSRIPTSP
jgi:hypothetical protein